MQQAVLNKDNKELKKIELNDSIFKAPVRPQLLFDAVQMYLTNKRQGTASAKVRNEVQGSTRKIYQQKGSGNARHGGIRANIFVGGGIAHPPRVRDWTYQLPRSAKKEAMKSALSLKMKEGKLWVVEELTIKEPKTKTVVNQLRKWKLSSCLLVVEKRDENLWKSVRNISSVSLVTADSLNAHEMMLFDTLVLTEGAVQILEKRLAI